MSTISADFRWQTVLDILRIFLNVYWISALIFEWSVHSAFAVGRSKLWHVCMAELCGSGSVCLVPSRQSAWKTSTRGNKMQSFEFLQWCSQVFFWLSLTDISWSWLCTGREKTVVCHVKQELKAKLDHFKWNF